MIFGTRVHRASSAGPLARGTALFLYPRALSALPSERPLEPARSERGSILVLAAVLIPSSCSMCGLVIDVGNWYTHKRQLQNKADAEALAAGVEYIAQMANCKTAPGATGTAISNVAKNFAGTNEATGGTNTTRRSTSAEQPDGRDQRDERDRRRLDRRGKPVLRPHCRRRDQPQRRPLDHVKVRETNLGSLASGFGLGLTFPRSPRRPASSSTRSSRSRAGCPS